MTLNTYSPLEQFEIFPIVPLRVGSFDLSFTNSSLRRFLTVGFIVAFTLRIGRGSGSLVPNRWQVIAEAIYGVVQTMVGSNAKTQRYFVLIFTIFTFLRVANLLGLIPYSFTFTSHIIVTFALTLAVWVGKLIIAVYNHGIRFRGMFLPSGVPVLLAFLVVPLELLGFFRTLVSLSVRLFANRRAGHILLKVIAGFAWSRRMAGGLVWVSHFLPLGVLFLLMGLETGVALIQAYVFSLLSARYISDAIEGGH